MIRLASAGPIPGIVSNCSSLALLTSSLDDVGSFADENAGVGEIATDPENRVVGGGRALTGCGCEKKLMTAGLKSMLELGPRHGAPVSIRQRAEVAESRKANVGIWVVHGAAH